MYGTSMVVSGGYGLGETTSSIDWGGLINTGLQTGLDIWGADQKRRDLELQRQFEIQMAKLTQGASIQQSKDSSGETTADGMWGGNKNLYIGIGVAALAAVGYLALRKKRR